MERKLRDKKRINYRDDNLTDDYGRFGTFAINSEECIIQQESTIGLLIAGSATYPYFCDIYYFEKQINQLNRIDGIETYYNWVKGNYKYLLPHYRHSLIQQIPIKYKYSMGDIIFIVGNDEIGQIESRQYDMDNNKIVYNIRIIDIDLNKNSLITLKLCKDIVEDRIQIVISALDCVNKWNNNPQTMFITNSKIQCLVLFLKIFGQYYSIYCTFYTGIETNLL